MIDFSVIKISLCYSIYFNYPVYADLASFYYAIQTRKLLQINNIPFLPWKDNPIQERSIEASLNSKLCDNGWKVLREE